MMDGVFSTRDEQIKALLGQAAKMRHAACETAMPEYRDKMLKLARQLEEKAADVEGFYQAWANRNFGIAI